MGDAEEVEETIFRCSGCSAPLTYSPGKTALKCEYCGKEHLIEQLEKEIMEHEFAELEPVPHTSTLGFGVSSRQFMCDRCGAVTALPGALVATKCAFCGSDVVVEKPPLEGMLMPESLVPFKINATDALSRFRKWLRKLWFRPSDLKKKAALADIDGMYAPHFTYDSDVFSRWSGWAGHYYYVTVGTGKNRRTVRKVSWRFRSGTHDAFYNDELVCASKGLPIDILKKIYPYNLNALTHYKPGYLSGFMAEAYTIDPRDAWLTAKSQMHGKEVSACSSLLGGDTQRGLNVNSEYSGIKWKHILLPAYLAVYAYGKKTYRFMVNGQTGEVQGEAPYSWWKIAGAVIGISAIVIVVAAVAMGWI
ncbi:MAG: hypothetical protein KAI64_02580 [Thermoplasmata archaeon]|nr:hypothetical protein [Thermoplasmata archaeon]